MGGVGVLWLFVPILVVCGEFPATSFSTFHFTISQTLYNPFLFSSLLTPELFSTSILLRWPPFSTSPSTGWFCFVSFFQETQVVFSAQHGSF